MYWFPLSSINHHSYWDYVVYMLAITTKCILCELISPFSIVIVKALSLQNVLIVSHTHTHTQMSTGLLFFHYLIVGIMLLTHQI